ncbi:hypothetical protein IW150_000387, partial [Coemansia sp. RSA 2607]
MGMTDETLDIAAILVLRDSASGFIEAYPVEDMTTETTIAVLRENWINLYGAPTVISSDNALA